MAGLIKDRGVGDSVHVGLPDGGVGEAGVFFRKCRNQEWWWSFGSEKWRRVVQAGIDAHDLVALSYDRCERLHREGPDGRKYISEVLAAYQVRHADDFLRLAVTGEKTKRRAMYDETGWHSAYIMKEKLGRGVKSAKSEKKKYKDYLRFQSEYTSVMEEIKTEWRTNALYITQADVGLACYPVGTHVGMRFSCVRQHRVDHAVPKVTLVNMDESALCYRYSSETGKIIKSGFRDDVDAQQIQAPDDLSMKYKKVTLCCWLSNGQRRAMPPMNVIIDAGAPAKEEAQVREALAGNDRFRVQRGCGRSHYSDQGIFDSDLAELVCRKARYDMAGFYLFVYDKCNSHFVSDRHRAELKSQRIYTLQLPGQATGLLQPVDTCGLLRSIHAMPSASRGGVYSPLFWADVVEKFHGYSVDKSFRVSGWDIPRCDGQTETFVVEKTNFTHYTGKLQSFLKRNGGAPIGDENRHLDRLFEELVKKDLGVSQKRRKLGFS